MSQHRWQNLVGIQQKRGIDQSNPIDMQADMAWVCQKIVHFAYIYPQI